MTPEDLRALWQAERERVAGKPLGLQERVDYAPGSGLATLEEIAGSEDVCTMTVWELSARAAGLGAKS